MWYFGVDLNRKWFEIKKMRDLFINDVDLFLLIFWCDLFKKRSIDDVILLYFEEFYVIVVMKLYGNIW